MTDADLNRDQIEYWNGSAGERWVRDHELTDRAFSRFGQAGLDALAAAPGERVLDVGCGAGQSVLAIASAVGPAGAVVGIDVSRPLLERARQRAQAHENVSF